MSKEFDECIIHIGTEKTGTTTLQKFFRQNELNLDKNHIFYPKTFGNDNHGKLFVFASYSKKIDSLKLMLGLNNLQEVEIIKKKLISSFHEEIKNQNCKKLLLSTELFHSRLTNNEEIKFLKNFLDDFTKSYKIIVYLRSQIDLATSKYSELLKDGEMGISILPDVEENNQYYNYEKLLARWEKVFGRDNINVKIFSENNLIGGDIKKDFINYLNLNWNDFQEVENINLSLNSETQLFLLGINPYLPALIDGKVNLSRRILKRSLLQNTIGKGLLPTREEALRFFNIFRNSNENVRKKWFPGREKLFDIDFNKFPNETCTIKDHSFVFKIFADLWSSNLQKDLILFTHKAQKEIRLRNEELRARNQEILKKNKELRARNQEILKKNKELRERLEKKNLGI